MKKSFIVATLALFAALGMGVTVGCADDNQNQSSASYSYSYPSQDQSNALTETDAKLIAIQELADEISLNSRLSWNDDIDADSCTITISNVKQYGNMYIFYGTCYFRNIYGQYETKYSDGSGGISDNFEIRVNEYGRRDAHVSWK